MTARNSAARYLQILEHVRKSPDKTPMWTVFDQLLGADDETDTQARAVEAFGQILAMKTEISRELVESGNNENSFLDSVQVMVKGLAKVHPGHQVVQWKNHISDAAIRELEICNTLISRHDATRTVPRQLVLEEAAVGSLLSRLQDLRNDLGAEVDIDRDLRNSLLHHLEAMELALQEYIHFGSAALDRALREFAADAIVGHETYGTDAGKNWLGKIWGAFKDVNAAIAAGSLLLSLVGEVVPLTVEVAAGGGLWVLCSEVSVAGGCDIGAGAPGEGGREGG